MTNLKTILMCLLMTISVNVFSQNENRNWIFGDRTSITINQSNNPNGYTITNNNNTPLVTEEGSTVCSDVSGNLVFYTDGRTLYDSNNAIIRSNLGSNASSTSSAISIAIPNNNNRFLLAIINLGDSPSNPSNLLIYTIERNNNNNSINIVGNPIQVVGRYSEKLAITREENTCNYIMAAFKIDSALTTTYPIGIHNTSVDFFRIDSSGFNSTPIFNLQINDILANNNRGHGYIKFSPDRKLFCFVAAHDVLLYNVNFTNNGINLTNRRRLNINTNLIGNDPSRSVFYGCEFTRDSNTLYITETGYSPVNSFSAGRIFKITDLQQNNPISNILTLGSNFDINKNRTGNYHIGAIQRIPFSDDMFIANPLENFIYRLTNTTNANTGIERYNLNTGCFSRLGLPTFVSGQVNCNDIVQNTGCCPNQTNLIQNGGFNNANQNITSDYTRNNAVMPGQYNILPFNQLSRTCSNWNTTNQDQCNNGNVLVVNGRTQQTNDSNNRVVSFDFQKEAWGQYRFCFDVQALNNCCFNMNAPLTVEYYELDHNTTTPRQVLPITLNPGNCGWTRVSLNISTGSGSTAGRIVIILGQTIISDGNDFAFDNFSLTNIANFESEIGCDNCTSSYLTGVTLISPQNYNPTNQYCWIIGEVDSLGNMTNLMSGGTLNAWANLLNIPFNNSWGLSTTFNGYNRQVGRTYKVIFYSNPISECDNGSWSGFEFRSTGSNFRILNRNEVEKSLLKINPKILEFKQDIIIKNKDIKKNSNSKLESTEDRLLNPRKN